MKTNCFAPPARGLICAGRGAQLFPPQRPIRVAPRAEGWSRGRKGRIIVLRYKSFGLKAAVFSSARRVLEAPCDASLHQFSPPRGDVTLRLRPAPNHLSVFRELDGRQSVRERSVRVTAGNAGSGAQL